MSTNITTLASSENTLKDGIFTNTTPLPHPTAAPMVPTTTDRPIQRPTQDRHGSLLAARAQLQSQRPDPRIAGREIW